LGLGQGSIHIGPSGWEGQVSGQGGGINGGYGYGQGSLTATGAGDKANREKTSSTNLWFSEN